MPLNAEGGHRASVGAQNFKELLLEVSTLFINLPIDSIDEVIEDTQKKICESLGVDLSSLRQWSDRDRNLLTVSHL